MFEEGQKNNTNKSGLIYAIVGVAVLIVAVAGSAYAYYSATATDTSTVKGTAGGGAAPTLTVKKESNASGNLVPIDKTAETLTKGAKGWNKTSNAVNTSWNAAQSCTDKNGNTVCQVYSVTVKNNSNTSVIYDISLTALSGAKTPNLDAVKMASNISVTSETSIKGVNKGICTTASVAGGGTSTACYFMVFITNLNSAQTDSGAFTGTVTAVGSNGAEVKAQF
ncbi:MAG: hypothetical protein SPF04_02070 [Bacilli bacterium]|nr:hypothetical protein [Bacilli bacterium]